jgi:CspA family cold shock protein
MLNKRIFLIAMLVAGVLLAIVVARSMVGAVGWVPLVLLFVGGAGAGLSVSGLRRPKTSVSPVSPRRAPDRARDRSRTVERNKGSRRRPQRKPKVKSTGKVKWFDETKGFGFITLDDGEADCFVHRSAIQEGDSLVEGKQVGFNVIKDERGRKAAANVVTI